MYKLDKENKSLMRLEPKLFSDIGLKERQDIEEWIEKNPKILGEELLIISKEYSGFDKTNERLDLLGIDLDGNIVVIELKRDDSGKGVDWQAIKYASYCARLSEEDIFSIYSEYTGMSEEDAQKEIADFCQDSILNEKQRIILVSRDFRSEITSSIMWLLDQSIDIKCIVIKPYQDQDSGQIFIDARVLLPLPEAEQYRIGRKKVENEQSEKRQLSKDMSIADHLNKGSKQVIEIYGQLTQRLKSRLPQMQEIANVAYIAFRERRNFATVKIRGDHIRVYILPVDTPFSTKIDCTIVPESHRRTLNKTFTLNSLDEETMNEAIELIMASYEAEAR